MNRGAWQAAVHGILKEMDTTEQLIDYAWSVWSPTQNEAARCLWKGSVPSGQGLDIVQ